MTCWISTAGSPGPGSPAGSGSGVLVALGVLLGVRLLLGLLVAVVLVALLLVALLLVALLLVTLLLVALVVVPLVVVALVGVVGLLLGLGRGMRRSWVVASSMTGAAGACWDCWGWFFFAFLALRSSTMIGSTEMKTMRSSIASMLVLTNSILPSQEPRRVTPAPQRMPPTTLKMRNVRYRMPLTPAMIGVNVRTMGTKRARTRDFGPCFSKNSWALVTFSCLNRRESGRLNSAGPTFLPNM